jgi:hypothetical protein
MRIHDIINEVADQPYKPIIQSNRAEKFVAIIPQTDSGSRIQIRITQETADPGTVEVGFFDETDQTKPTIAVTGKGDAFRIFATVGAVVNMYVKKFAPDSIEFGGKSSEGGRIKLYDMIARNIGRYLPGYKLDQDHEDFQAGEKRYKFSRANESIEENFADGKGPGRPGDSQRHGIRKHATMAELEKASHAKGRKGQLARWQLNMRRGKKHASEGLTETREGALNWLKNYLPTWPEYVLRDWLYRNLTKIDPGENPKEVVDRSLSGEGMSAQTQWKLVPNFEFKMEKLHPDTQRRIKIRAGGSSNPMKVPKDAERHATQAALAQQQGGVRKEPVIGKMTPQGFELIEGWHRTIQHFKMLPDGYRGPAWVAMNAKNESVSEVAKVKLSTEPDNFGAWVNDSGKPEKTVVIPTNKIHVFEPDNKFDNPQHAKNLANIVKAIKAGKKLPPILVRRHGIDRFQVVDGHHRFMAYRMAGVKNIPARVIDPKNITGNVEEATTNRKAIEIKNFMPEPGSILKITGHLLDRIVERTLDKDKISQLFGMAVKKQYRKEFLDAKEGDKLLIKTKSGFGIPIVKIQRPEGIYVYTAKTCHETIYPHPEDKILIVNAPDPSILESTLIGSLPSNKERWAPQVRGEKSAGDVAKKSQKPGVLNQKHAFNGRLVGGS